MGCCNETEAKGTSLDVHSNDIKIITEIDEDHDENTNKTTVDIEEPPK